MDCPTQVSIIQSLFAGEHRPPLAFVYEIATSPNHKAVAIFQRLPAHYRQHDPTDAWQFALEESSGGDR